MQDAPEVDLVEPQKRAKERRTAQKTIGRRVERSDATVPESYINYNTLTIGFHNINGIKANRGKVENIIDYMKEKDINIMEIGETNISEKEERYFTRGNNIYGSFWVSADANKKKGSGVGIILKRIWEKHIAQVNRDSPYLLELTL